MTMNDTETQPSATALCSLRERLERGGPLRLAGLGDSLTYGWLVQRGFFDRFADGLERRFPKAALRRSNHGVPGDTAAGGLGRVGHVLREGPDVVTVQFGLNDLFCGVPPAAFARDMDDIAERILEAGALPVLATSSPLQWPEEQRAAESFYGAIRDIGARRSLPVADCAAHWRASAGPPAAWSRLLQDDGVHPTDAGHALMAEALLALLG